ncbi:MAG: DUF2846 domain-containing protein [Bacteroidales bacterium]|jgi:hypothetical protein|nr:DUF2846 domain-containing protein [Bacteroidales bacterium]
MKQKNSTTKRNVLTGVMMSWLVLFAASLLLTNCGSGRTAASVDNTPEAPEYELSDDCALLHIYRPGSMAGMAVSYHIHLDDEPLFRVKNKSKTTVRLTSEGVKTLWGRTETKEEVPIEIKLGKEYYIRCGVKMGALVGRPRIEIVDNAVGKSEFDKIQLKKK